MFNSIWYTNLIRPALSPPSWVFSPVWTFLYILIFISLACYIKSKSKNEDKKLGYCFFIIQMFLNLIWTPVFFGLKSISGAFAVIILLDIFVILTIYKFFKSSKIAGLLLIPYFIWIIFATYLNLGYMLLN